MSISIAKFIMPNFLQKHYLILFIWYLRKKSKNYNLTVLLARETKYLFIINIFNQKNEIFSKQLLFINYVSYMIFLLGKIVLLMRYFGMKYFDKLDFLF